MIISSNKFSVFPQISRHIIIKNIFNNAMYLRLWHNYIIKFSIRKHKCLKKIDIRLCNNEVANIIISCIYLSSTVKSIHFVIVRSSCNNKIKISLNFSITCWIWLCRCSIPALSGRLLVCGMRTLLNTVLQSFFSLFMKLIDNTHTWQGQGQFTSMQSHLFFNARERERVHIKNFLHMQ